MGLEKKQWRLGMPPLLVCLSIGLVLAGCASLGIQTEGQTQSLQWRATDFRNDLIELEEREIYAYTLVLQETLGATITFTALQGEFQNNPTSRLFSMSEIGSWKLPANGELRIPLQTYRYCHVVNCDDWGDLAPVWRLMLIGTDTQGQPVREVIRMQLPYVTQTRRSARR